MLLRPPRSPRTATLFPGVQTCALPIFIWCMTPSGRPIYFSRHMREFLGFDVAAKDEPDVPRLQSLLGAIIHPDDLDRVNERLDHSLRTGAPYALTHRQRRFDGTFRWVETRLAARSEEHTSELQSLMRTSYAVF